MRSNTFVLVSTALATLALGACGSIVNGSSQKVNVVVKGSPSAWCQFTNSKFKNSGSFPNSVTLERSHENLIAECRGEQGKYKKFEIPSTMTTAGSAGNIATGVVPGTAYDAMSGGMWTYPDPIIVDFRRDPRDAPPNDMWPENKADVDQTAIGTADIAPPKPAHMQPIMDDQLNPALPATHEPLAKPEVIDAVRLATDKQAAESVSVTKVETVTTTPAKAAQMKPIVSPEDDPKVLKAKQEAKEKAAQAAKAKAEAKKKAEAAAKAKAAADKAEAEKLAAEKAAANKAAADQAAAAAAAPSPAPTTTTPSTAPVAPAPDASLPSTAPTGPAPSGLMASPTPDPAASGTAPQEGQSVDKKDYLEGQ